MAKVEWIPTVQQDKDEQNFAWVNCASTSSEDIEPASRYVFEVRRYKIVATKEEFLNIKALEVDRDQSGAIIDYEECAEIEKVSIIDLEAKLLDLRNYGVVLERKHFPKIRQAIEKVYGKLSKRPIDTSAIVTDAVIRSIYEMFVRYIKGVGIEQENGLYNILVTEFKEYLSETEYSKYKYADIRAGLAQLKVDKDGKAVNATKCSYGRNDNTVKIKDKRVKVISFVGKVVDGYQITELPEASTENE